MAKSTKEAVKMTQAEIDEGAIIIKADAQLGTIDDNFDLLEVEITRQMAKYTGLEFDDTSIIEARATRAELNKMITVIEEKRKAIKRKWNDPYTAFEARVKKIVSIIQAPMAEIDAQLTEYEERRRAEKQAAIDAEIESQLEAVPWRPEFVRKIGVQFDPRWLNATMAMSKVISDIDAQIKQIINDGTTIERLSANDMEMQEELLDHYLDGRDITATMGRLAQINERRERARKAEEEAKAREEAARKAAEEAAAAAAAEAEELKASQADLLTPVEADPPVQYAEEPVEEPVQPELVPTVETEAIFETTFKVEITKSQSMELVTFFRSRSIPFTLIENKKKGA